MDDNTFKSFDPKYCVNEKQSLKDIEENINKIKNFAEDDNKILIIYGMTGCGKTHLMDAFRHYIKYYLDPKLMNIHEDKQAKLNNGWPSYYDSKTILFTPSSKIYYVYFTMLYPKLENALGYSFEWREAYSSDYFLIDDLGSERVDDKGIFLEAFKEILDRRRKKIIISTNLSRKSLEERYGSKIYSRLCQGRVDVFFKQKKDYRRENEK